MPPKKTARRSAGDGGLYQREDGLWVATIELPAADGKRRRKTVSSRNRNECVKKRRELQAQIDAGLTVFTAKTTVAQWLWTWLEDIHRPTVRPKTYDYYNETIRLHIEPHIGNVRLDRLTLQDVRGLHKTVQKYSTRSAVAAHQTLQRALADAVREGMVVRNVAALVTKPKHVADVRNNLTAQAAQHMIRTAIDNGDPMSTRWAAAFLTGIRQGEALGLTWELVDLNAGVINIAWQLQNLPQRHGCGEPSDTPPAVPYRSDRPAKAPFYPCGRTRPSACPQRAWATPAGFEMGECYGSLCWTRPKSGAGRRIVPLIPAMVEMLRVHRANGPASPHDLVWCQPDGKPIHPRDDYKAWQRALAAAELEPAPLHSARHTTATLLMAAGIDPRVRREIMGQSSDQAHQGYVHVDTTHMLNALTSLSGLVARSPG